MKDQEFEDILRCALQPPVHPEDTVVSFRRSGKGTTMTMRNMMKKSCIAAAVLILLTTTVYAAGAMNIRTLRSGAVSRRYDSVSKAEEKAGFEMDDLEEFSNGYCFEGVRVEQTEGLDEKEKVRLTYSEINVALKNAAGERLHLIVHEKQEGIEASDVPADLIRQMGDIPLEYRMHHYKFVPEDYAQTEEDRLWLQQPGNYMSYGSEDGISESMVAFLNWEKDGICYLLMDSDGTETADSLFSMAVELIHSGK